MREVAVFISRGPKGNYFMIPTGRIFLVLVLALLSFATGCASLPSSSSTTEQLRKRVRDLEWANAKQRRQLARQRKQPHNDPKIASMRQIDTELQSANRSPSKKPKKPGFAQVLPQKVVSSQQHSSPANREEVWTESNGEQFLYGQVLEDYRRSDLIALEKTTGLLLKGYPQSVFADNALYLVGTLALFQKDHPKSLHYFHRVGQEYPMGNKVVAALYGEAMLYKKLGNQRKSEDLMKKIMKNYPGSPEGSLAVNEFKH